MENQVTDCAFRIGQRRNVLVHMFITRGTVEERIDAMIADKRQLAQEVRGAEQEISLTELCDDELLRPGPVGRIQRHVVGSRCTHGEEGHAPDQDRRAPDCAQLLGQTLICAPGVVLQLRQLAPARSHLRPQRRDSAPGDRRGAHPGRGPWVPGVALPGLHPGKAAPGSHLEGDPEGMLRVDRLDPGAAPRIALRPG